MLTLSAVLAPPHPSECINNTCSSPSQFQNILFFCSLYLVALGQGAHKPCMTAFGADQFDQQDPEERKSMSSFFNWWYFGMAGGITISIPVMSYIQDNQGWGLGFGLPCISFAFSLVAFLLGTKIYRYKLPSGENPFTKILKIFFAGSKNCKDPSSTTKKIIKEEQCRVAGVLEHSDFSSPLNDWRICRINEGEETKGISQLFFISVTCLVFQVVYMQSVTFFIKQGTTMNRNIVLSFQIPAAALRSFMNASVLVFIAIYDRVLVPVAKTFTKISSGITMLQRIGIGMFLFAVSMAVAALVEMKRLKIARDFGLIDLPSETIPMIIWWLLPQYLLFGVADVFFTVGLQEFFYDQMPNGLKSLGIALFLSIMGVGSLLSGFLIYLIQKISDGSWFCNNLNRAHLDHFYWILCGLSIIALSFYLFISKSYVYRRNN